MDTSMTRPLNELGIVFNIDDLGGGGYGSKAWHIFMKNVDPNSIAPCILKHGDTRQTLNGSKIEYCIAVYSTILDLNPLALVFKQLSVKGLAPISSRFIEGQALYSEPLVLKGRIDATGRLVTDEWNRGDHDLCKETKWSYAPLKIPVDLQSDLRAELDKMTNFPSTPIDVGNQVNDRDSIIFDASKVSFDEYEKELKNKFDYLSELWVYEDGLIADTRKMAKDLMSQHGELITVFCDAHPKTIRLVFQDGVILTGDCDRGYFMQFGYQGTGPSRFWAFLDECGFKVPYWAICKDSSYCGEPIRPDTLFEKPRAFSIKAHGPARDEVRKVLEELVPPVAEDIHWEGDNEDRLVVEAESNEEAIEKARASLPAGAKAITENILRSKRIDSLQVDAFSEANARGMARELIPSDASITAVEQLIAPKNSMLGFGKLKAGTYKVIYEFTAKVEIVYLIPNKPMSISYTIISKKRFFFSCGKAVSTVNELLQHCREHKDEAMTYLSRGDFDGWLCSRWAQVSKLARKEEKNTWKQLDFFVDTIDRRIKGRGSL
jgi:hypothetical protein